MTTIAIIGAGPGLGLATARRFGREWFSVALISRSQNKLDRLVDELAADATTAAGYPADVQNRTTLAAALDKDSSELGPIEVLQYSPVPRQEFLRPVLDTTAEDLSAATEFSILGPVTAVEQVLDGMTELGRGTVFVRQRLQRRSTQHQRRGHLDRLRRRVRLRRDAARSTRATQYPSRATDHPSAPSAAATPSTHPTHSPNNYGQSTPNNGPSAPQSASASNPVDPAGPSRHNPHRLPHETGAGYIWSRPTTRSHPR
ncbi:SDR family NAD(P)-dependent oxidoreductase [Nocardia sp. NPDC127606]|uniref:SDR family NAD(P)-dependent oxidoreductase n=1 Tax=Nocardia sp. NPDC127606 TaxID=3345406 RepID=UPI00362ACEC5